MEDERPGRAAAIAEAKSRWGLARDDATAVRQTFLKRLAAGAFAYDPALIADLALLDERSDTPESLCLVERQEHLQLQQLGECLRDSTRKPEQEAQPESDENLQVRHAKFGEFHERLRALQVGFDSPLSGAWYAEIREMFEPGESATQGIAFEVVQPPPRRRPHKAAIEVITEYLAAEREEEGPDEPTSGDLAEFSPGGMGQESGLALLRQLPPLLLATVLIVGLGIGILVAVLKDKRREPAASYRYKKNQTLNVAPTAKAFFEELNEKLRGAKPKDATPAPPP